jgi:hypothetical protein
MHLSHESVDTYYNSFHELLEDLSYAEDKISTKSAMHHFIFTLGPEFEVIQKKIRIGNLPLEWNTNHWPTLLVLCRDYYNSVNPSGIAKCDPHHDNSVDRAAHHKTVKQWFLNSLKYCREIEAEQAKHPGKCIYHLSKSHLMAECHVKKECEKLSNTVKTSGTTSYSQATQPASNGQLRHITEEVFEDAFDSAASDDLVESANDTNEADLLYFAHVTNHYLCLVKAAPSKTLPSCHQLKYRVIADSGASSRRKNLLSPLYLQ